MLPPTSPYSRSMRATTRSAWASSSSSIGLPAQVWGTHWVNIETMWCPSGARVLSNTDGMQTSANGTAEGRPAGELGQPVDGQVDLDGAAASLPALDVGHEVVGQIGPLDLREEGDPAVGGGHDHVGGHLLAALQHDSGGPAVAGGDAPHRGPGADLGPE